MWKKLIKWLTTPTYTGSCGPGGPTQSEKDFLPKFPGGPL